MIRIASSRLFVRLVTLLASLVFVTVFARAASAADVVYVLDQVNGGANQIYAFRVNGATGALTLLERLPRSERRASAARVVFRAHGL